MSPSARPLARPDGEDLFDQAWRLLTRIELRLDCWWAMDPATWDAILRDPRSRDAVDCHPQFGDYLFGCRVVVGEQFDGLNLVTIRQPALIRSHPHPQTQAIDAEFGWGDAQTVTFTEGSVG